jgi:hypothetical protein
MKGTNTNNKLARVDQTIVDTMKPLAIPNNPINTVVLTTNNNNEIQRERETFRFNLSTIPTLGSSALLATPMRRTMENRESIKPIASISIVLKFKV